MNPLIPLQCLEGFCSNTHTHTHMQAQAPQFAFGSNPKLEDAAQKGGWRGTRECLGTGGSHGNSLAAATRGRQEMMKSHFKLDFRNNLFPLFHSPKHTLAEQAVSPRHTGTTQQRSQRCSLHGSGIVPPSTSRSHSSLPPCTQSWGKASLYFTACVGAGCSGSTQKVVMAGMRECGPVLGGTWITALDPQTCCW